MLELAPEVTRAGGGWVAHLACRLQRGRTAKKPKQISTTCSPLPGARQYDKKASDQPASSMFATRLESWLGTSEASGGQSGATRAKT